MSDVLLLYGLAIGGLLGGILTWLFLRLRRQKDYLTRSEVDQDYVHRAHYEATTEVNQQQQTELDTQRQRLEGLAADLGHAQAQVSHLQERLQSQQTELAELQQHFHQQFEATANKLLEEKTQKFTEQNAKQVDALLHPLREHIKLFEAGIKERFVEETRDRSSLKKEIEQLRLLNQQLTEEASNLTNALKGDNKVQGDWGEYQLELLLQKAGLTKDVHYRAQPTFTAENGAAQRPDFIINLPEDKHLIIDSKVSLVAFERYYNAPDDKARTRYLKKHLESIKAHIQGLRDKNYPQLYQINSPDFLLLFVPLEPAFATALQADPKLFTNALEKNIVLVSSTTLLVTMRTVAFIWKQEKQKQHVQEIARQSGMLYDKFVAFVDDLQSIGQKLDQAQSTYHAAFNKLKDSKKYGDTLMGRAERIRKLGAKTSKVLPPELLPPEETG